MKSFFRRIKRFLFINLFFKRILLPYIKNRGIFLKEEAKKPGCIRKLELVEKKSSKLTPFDKLIQVDEAVYEDRFLSSHSYKNEDKFLYEVEDAILVGPYGLICDSKGHIIRDTISFDGTGRVEAYLTKSFIEKPLKTINGMAKKPNGIVNAKKQSIKIGMSLCSVWVNYFHWIIEELPKLRALEMYHEKYGVKPTLILPNNNASYIKESLQIMGYEVGKDAIIYKKENLFVNKLILQTFPEITPELVQWLRNRAFKNINIKNKANGYKRRLYLSRLKAGNRNVVNKNELMDLLNQYNFEEIHLENMSVSEQIRTLNDAEIVVACHGAGLTNILWSTDLTVIEIFGYTLKTTYSRLSEACGHRYKAIAGFPIEKNHRSDFIVDIKKMQEVFNEMNIDRD